MGTETLRIRATSRMRFSRPLNYGGIVTWEMPEFPTIAPADDDFEHDVVGSDRTDLLSQRYYGTPDLGWVIALANGWELWPNSLNAGDKLVVPSKERVLKKIVPMALKSREARGS